MKTIRYAFVRSLPIMAGYIVLGLGFGVLLQSKGYGAGWALVMSGLIYAGSMQYVAIDLLAGGASLISAAIMTLMVNARHLFYGISMLERYRDTGAAKPYLIFALTDETYSVVCSGGVPEGVDRKKYCSPVHIRLPSAGMRGAACATWRARSRSAWRAHCWAVCCRLTRQASTFR